MKPDPMRKFRVEQWPNHLYQDWEPNEKDIQLIRERIRIKINQKPTWYRWTNKTRN